MEINRDQVRRRLYISHTPLYMDVLSIITASVHTEYLNLSWLTKLVIQSNAPILDKLKRDYEQEQRIKKLEKELFEQKMMCENLKRNMASQREEFKIIEEAQARGYNELKETMQKQSETMTNMISEMMEMTKKQAKH